jgi:hypothetical protein
MWKKDKKQKIRISPNSLHLDFMWILSIPFLNIPAVEIDVSDSNWEYIHFKFVEFCSLRHLWIWWPYDQKKKIKEVDFFTLKQM